MVYKDLFYNTCGIQTPTHCNMNTNNTVQNHKIKFCWIEVKVINIQCIWLETILLFVYDKMITLFHFNNS